MQNQPLVSIICLCYNHGKFVAEALDSIIGQDYGNIEIIVVDDYSTDHSVDEIRRWISVNKTARFIANKSNIGNNKSFNQGLLAASGTYIMDFAADDILRPGCITELVRAIEDSQFQNTGVAYCNAQLISEHGDPIGTFFPTDDRGQSIVAIPSGNIYKSLIGSGNKICPVAMLVHRKVWDVLKQYDESLAYEDLDFWIRSARLFDYEYVDQLLCSKRVVSNSLGSQYKKRFSKRSYAINHTTYKILRSAFAKYIISADEDTVLKKRINYEVGIALRTLDPFLLLRYATLLVQMKFKKRR